VRSPGSTGTTRRQNSNRHSGRVPRLRDHRRGAGCEAKQRSCYWRFLTLRVSYTTSTLLTGKQLTRNSTWRSCDVCVNQFAENDRKNGEMATGSSTTTMRPHTLHIFCSSFWPNTAPNIKMAENDKVLAVLRDTGGQIEYKYTTGQVWIVTLAMSGLGTKCMRVANLPPELSHEALRAALTPHGKILDIQVERWSKSIDTQWRMAYDRWPKWWPNMSRPIWRCLDTQSCSHMKGSQPLGMDAGR